MTYEDTYRGTNIGDYIQSLAAEQYLPQIDRFVNREHLNEVQDRTIKLIMNGWFTHHPENWPPSESIDPLFVAFHINAAHADKILTPQSIEYLKMHEPIGCRDKYTTDRLLKEGLNAYFSGCLTLTLDKKYRIEDKYRSEKIYIVDPLFNLYSFREAFTSLRFLGAYLIKGRFLQSSKRAYILRHIISNDILKKASYRHHMLKPNNLSEDKRFEIAKNLLTEYAHSRCVITSRIHCALPCLALGTPVIFIDSFTDDSNVSRLDGLRDLFNVVSIDLNSGKVVYSDVPLEDGKITEKSIIPNKNNYLKYAEALKVRASKFIKNE